MKSRFTIVGRTHTKRFYNSQISEKSIIYILKKSKNMYSECIFFLMQRFIDRQKKRKGYG